MTWVGVAGFEPAASSSRTKEQAQVTDAIKALTCRFTYHYVPVSISVLQDHGARVAHVLRCRHLFAPHPGRRCKPRSTLFSRHRGQRCRPPVRVPKLAFPMLLAVFLAVGCGVSDIGSSPPSPRMPPPAYGKSVPSSSPYVPYRPDSEASVNQPTGVSTFTTDSGITSAVLMLTLLGMWHIGPALGGCFVDWVRIRRARRARS